MAEAVTNCPHCLSPLPAGALVCPTCHRLVHEYRLRQLIEEIQRAEQIDPIYAGGLIRQAMALVPPGSQPYQMLAAHAQQLGSRSFGGGGTAGPAAEGGGPHILGYAAPAAPRSDSLPKALLMTGGSMALSIFVYQSAFGWTFAIGFVLLILVHELGHVLANWYYGLEQSAPIFIPYMGAVIFLRGNPPDAKAEAVVGIAGPVAGTLGALACYAASLWVRDPVFGLQLQLLAHFAFFMNLFNLVPCPPLDGGRIAAAISPLLWIAGVPMFVAVIFFLGGRRLDWVTILLAFWILQSALPRVRNALMQGGRRNRYYSVKIGPRVMVAASYVLLAALLAVMYWGPKRMGLSFF